MIYGFRWGWKYGQENMTIGEALERIWTANRKQQRDWNLEKSQDSSYHCGYFLFPDLFFRQITTIWTQYLLLLFLFAQHVFISWDDCWMTKSCFLRMTISYDYLPLTIISIEHDLARLCVQLWPIICSKSDKILKQILSPSEPIMRGIIENMISP